MLHKLGYLLYFKDVNELRTVVLIDQIEAITECKVSGSIKILLKTGNYFFIPSEEYKQKYRTFEEVVSVILDKNIPQI